MSASSQLSLFKLKYGDHYYTSERDICLHSQSSASNQQSTESEKIVAMGIEAQRLQATIKSLESFVLSLIRNQYNANRTVAKGSKEKGAFTAEHESILADLKGKLAQTTKAHQELKEKLNVWRRGNHRHNG